MKTTYLIAAAAGLMSFALSAQAMPVAKPGVTDEQVIRVAGGCGPGWHPNYYGRCVPNYYGAYGYPRPYAYPRPYV